MAAQQSVPVRVEILIDLLDETGHLGGSPGRQFIGYCGAVKHTRGDVEGHPEFEGHVVGARSLLCQVILQDGQSGGQGLLGGLESRRS